MLDRVKAIVWDKVKRFLFLKKAGIKICQQCCSLLKKISSRVFCQQVIESQDCHYLHQNNSRFERRGASESQGGRDGVENKMWEKDEIFKVELN